MLTSFAKNEINSILKDDLKNEGVKNTFPKPDIDFTNKNLEIKGLTESYTIAEIIENDSVFVVFGNTLNNGFVALFDENFDQMQITYSDENNDYQTVWVLKQYNFVAGDKKEFRTFNKFVSVKKDESKKFYGLSINSNNEYEIFYFNNFVKNWFNEVYIFNTIDSFALTNVFEANLFNVNGQSVGSKKEIDLKGALNIEIVFYNNFFYLIAILKRFKTWNDPSKGYPEEREVLTLKCNLNLKFEIVKLFTEVGETNFIFVNKLDFEIIDDTFNVVYTTKDATTVRYNLPIDKTFVGNQTYNWTYTTPTINIGGQVKYRENITYNSTGSVDLDNLIKSYKLDYETIKNNPSLQETINNYKIRVKQNSLDSGFKDFEFQYNIRAMYNPQYNPSPNWYYVANQWFSVSWYPAIIDSKFEYPYEKSWDVLGLGGYIKSNGSKNLRTEVQIKCNWIYQYEQKISTNFLQINDSGLKFLKKLDSFDIKNKICFYDDKCYLSLYNKKTNNTKIIYFSFKTNTETILNSLTGNLNIVFSKYNNNLFLTGAQDFNDKIKGLIFFYNSPNTFGHTLGDEVGFEGISLCLSLKHQNRLKTFLLNKNQTKVMRISDSYDNSLNKSIPYFFDPYNNSNSNLILNRFLYFNGSKIVADTTINDFVVNNNIFLATTFINIETLNSDVVDNVQLIGQTNNPIFEYKTDISKIYNSTLSYSYTHTFNYKAIDLTLKKDNGTVYDNVSQKIALLFDYKENKNAQNVLKIKKIYFYYGNDFLSYDIKKDDLIIDHDNNTLNFTKDFFLKTFKKNNLQLTKITVNNGLSGNDFLIFFEKTYQKFNVDNLLKISFQITYN